MTEWRLFEEGTVPHVSTPEFFAPFPRTPHLEQPDHRPRLLAAAELVRDLAGDQARTLSDLGCGDGGLLSLVQASFTSAWGYDLQPGNAEGWPVRDVTAELLDVFGTGRDRARTGDVATMTEVLEHVADPHGVLRWLAGRSRYLVCSSPANETGDYHGPEHAWAWDMAGYTAMITGAGWAIRRHELCGRYQLVQAASPEAQWLP
jgi:hypothetical protein